MNNREKGKAFEKKIMLYLQAHGFTVDQARPTLKWVGPGKCFSSPCDFFGAADLVAVHPGRLFTLFIQAHAHHDRAARLEKLERVHWNLQAQRVQLWLPGKSRDSMRIYTLVGGTSWRESELRMYDSSPAELT